jgi:hypothetical protein
MTFGKQDNTYSNKKIVVAVIGSLILLFLTGAFLSFHRFLSARYEPNLISPVLTAIPADVSSIVISPIQTRPSHSNLVSSPVTIKDPADILRVCKALQRAKPFNPIHPASSWECLLVLSKKNGNYKCVVDSTDSSRNGVLIFFHSNGEWGWSIGEYRSDSLGAVLESLARPFGKI